MKSFSYSIITIFIALFALASCTDQDYEQLDKGNNQLALTVNQGAATLNERNHASDAVSLNWTTGTNYGTGKRICYKLELSTAANGNTYTAVDSMTQVYSWSASQENLNNILLDKLGGHAGQPSDIEARVTAIVDGEQPQTSAASFTVTPYTPVTSTLYIIGSATSTGWSADNAEALTRTDNGVFTWEGYLNDGTFKFITTRGVFLPSYNLNPADSSVVLRSSDDEPDEQWTVSGRHYYKMTVNLLDSTLTMTETAGVKPAYDQLFFVGNMTDWNFRQMTQDPLDNFLFRYGAVFDKGGEFKFGTAEGSWENMYKAAIENEPYTDTRMEFISGFDPDNKWYLKDDETGKAYKICVDIRKGNEKMIMQPFTPYQMIYLVGDASPAGWSLGDATPMTATDSPYIFTWTGELKAGELKFTCDKQSDWNGAWFLCARGNDVEPSGSTEHALFVDKSSDSFKNQYPEVNIGDVDQKWKITSSGTYTITLNQLEETVSIVKQ